MRRMHIKGIALDEKSRLPVLLLAEEGDGRVLPMTIGPSEASAIILELENLSPPRPMTHDLIASFFRTHGFSADSVEVYGFDGETYYARIRYHRGIHAHVMELRPSDGIAIALRLEAPVLVEDALLRETGASSFAPGIWNGNESDVLYFDSARDLGGMM